MKKRIISAITVLSLMFAGTTPVSATETEGLQYSISEDSYIIYNVENNGIVIHGIGGAIENVNELVIPDTIDSLPVTRINKMAFCDNEYLTSVTIPDTVVEIGYYAFDRCLNIKHIDMPSELTTIGNYAFNMCHSLESIELGGKLETISNNSFQLCINIKEHMVPGSVKTVPDHAFQANYSLEKIVFGEGVENIESEAMLNAKKIKRLYFPSTIKEIQPYAVAYAYWNGDYSPINTAIFFGYMNTAAQKYAEECGFRFLPYNAGDIDASGGVSAIDASLTLTEYAAIATNSGASFTADEKKLADVNCDRRINAVDASIMLEYYAYRATGGATEPIEPYDFFANLLLKD